MPSSIKPRPHQLECLQRVVSGNTIVNMPTGTGKTLVAVLAIDHFRESGKVIFLVPTRPLVLQQAEYVRENCAKSVAVAELQGAKTDHLSAAEWQDIVSSSDVLVGTAEVFRRALVDTKFLSLRVFSLLVFDECHNATGNSPMAAIMRDAVHRERSAVPRILGLTASFVHGSLKGIEKKRKDLEGLLQATLFCPDVEERPMDFERIVYEQTVLPEMEQVVESKVHALLGLAEHCGVPIKDTKSVIRRGVHVFSELGLAAFIYFLRECVAPQVEARIEAMEEVQPAERQGRAREVRQNIPRLRQAMRDAAEQLASDGSLTDFPNVTDKGKKLLELMQNLQQDGRQTRVIIFCEQTVLAHPLAHLLQHHTGIKTGTCTGVGSMTDGQRKQALQCFRSGSIPLLTCTAALEEGLDVSSCEVVVRFSKFQTTKSHIQGSGRARAWNARVFYFDNEPGRELAGASLMESTAKQSALSLSPSELLERRAHNDMEGVHPYRTRSGAEISIFNCVQLVYEYAARTMGASFRPEESMLSYLEELVCEFPPQRRKTLKSVTIPSPDGFFDVRAEDVNSWWGNVDLDAVADKARMRNWDGSNRELRRFLFVVAVILSKRGLLDDNNQPSARALHETRHACKAWTMSPGVRIGVRYDPQGLAAGSVQHSKNGVEHREPGQGYPGLGVTPAAAGQHQVAQQSKSSLGNGEGIAQGYPGAGVTLASAAQQEVVQQMPINHKGRLNELTHGNASYQTVPDTGGFRSTVTLVDGRSFRGAATASTKKAAEQLAADAALSALSCGN